MNLNSIEQSVVQLWRLVLEVLYDDLFAFVSQLRIAHEVALRLTEAVKEVAMVLEACKHVAVDEEFDGENITCCLVTPRIFGQRKDVEEKVQGFLIGKILSKILELISEGVQD